MPLADQPKNHTSHLDFTVESADARLTRYCEGLAPDAIIDAEFGRRLGDADLIEAILDQCAITRAEWDGYSGIEKRKLQVSFVAPPHCYF
jgi:hypothetical protein